MNYELTVLTNEGLTALTGDHPRYIGWVPLTRVLAQKAPEQGEAE